MSKWDFDIIVKSDVYPCDDGTFDWTATALRKSDGEIRIMSGKGCKTPTECHDMIREQITEWVAGPTEETRVIRMADDYFGTRNSFN